jgi:hypothetical protein
VRTVTRPGTSTTESTTSNTDTLLILSLVAMVALLVGIAYMILRDAHSVAPVSDGPVGSAATRNPAGKLRKRRAKAKAARRQRRLNR